MTQPGGGGRGRRPRSTAELQEQLRSARSDIRDQVHRTREQFDEANARITARTGRNLVFAIGLGVVLGGVLLISLLIWKPLFALLATALVAIGASELAVALRTAGIRVPRVGAAVTGAIAVPIAFASALPAEGVSGFRVPGGWLAAIAFAVLAAVLWRLVEQAGRPTAPRLLGRDLLVTAFVQLYVVGLGTSAVVLVAQDRGQLWVLSFVAVVVASDVFAYATGLRFGRHKMAPRISPGKTWEGFAGAAAATVVVGTVLSVTLLDRPLWFGPVFGIVLLLTGTLGDLGESMIKRDIGVKDMSSWLPGHGGILDRIDSILPSAAAALLLYVATS